MLPASILTAYQHYKAGKATPAEKQLLADWLFPEEGIDLTIITDNPDEEQEICQRVATRLQQTTGTIIAGREQVRSIPIWKWTAAASVLLLLTTGWLFLRRTSPQQQLAVVQQVTAIQPGTTTATLTLSDGTTVALDSKANTITDKNGVKIINLANGQLSYQHLSSAPPSSAISYNTLTTPKGGEYQIILPDGTRVWLNSSSSLRYPVAFDGKNRQVSLTGEAYFDVAPQAKQAFIVTVYNGLLVHVLGTSFNINAYRDEDVVKTTLVQGSVKVGSATLPALLLKPGQQSIVGAGTQELHEANVPEEIAWKEGFFEFNNLPVETVMKTLARWYDFEVEFRETVNARLTGTIPRKETLDKVFEILQQTKAVRFTIHGKNVTVSSL